MAPSTQTHHARRWLILAVLGIAQLMVILDATIVNIALPSAQEALGFSDGSRQWIVTAYALAFGSLLLLGGRLGDLFGRKRMFIVGLIGFAVASAIGGAAQIFEVLVAARALQGMFGALLAPAALSLLTTTFTDPRERGKAFAIYGAIAGAGGAIGLLLGGVLTEYLSWRWCMYVNLAFAIPAALGAMHPAAQRGRRARARARHPRHAHRDRPACSRSSTASRRPRPRAGAPASRSASSPPASSCWPRSSWLQRRVGHAAAAAARRRRPQPRRRLPRRRHRRRGHVRRLPVPHLLPAADARLLADQDRPRVPADVPSRSSFAATITTAKVLPRTGPRPLVVDRHAARLAGNDAAHRRRRRHRLRRARPARR